ncbi:MAG: HlyD family efflux transporter periplasmic adaptor subunit [Planctomycetaceae bacterium]
MSSASGLLPSTKRAIPLRARADLERKQIACQGRGYWVVKDPVALNYYQLQPEQHCILELLDGRRNLEEIRDGLLARYPYARPTLADIQQTVVDLHAKRLARGTRFGQGTSLVRDSREKKRKRWLSALQNVMYLRLPGWDPEPTLHRLYPVVRWMFEPWGVALCLTLVLSSWLLLAVKFESFRERLPEFHQFFGWPNLIYLWGTLALTKIIHELGHGLTCRHFGGECHQIGMILLVFSPTLYCDVSDSWMLPNKWQRILIGGAGMSIEAVLSSLALFGWWFTQPGLLNHLFLNIFFVSAVTTVIFNLNPLMRYDGYYMLSDLLEIPNLSRKASRMLHDTFAWWCFGIRTPPDPFMPDEGRYWFVVYAIASAVYRWVVVFGIAVFLYIVLKPYDLQSIGATMACVSLAGMVWSLARNLIQMLRASRQEPLSRTKMSVTAAIVLALALGALTIPIPWHLEAGFYIEPHRVQHVYNLVPGELRQIDVRPGQTVARGTRLIELVDAEKDLRLQEISTELRSQETELNTQLGLNDAVGAALARQRIAQTRKLLDDYRAQISLLQVAAPAEGVVIAPPPVKEQELSQPRIELGQWYGVPLDPHNVGCLLPAGTHLLSIAPDGRFQAVLLVDQADRVDLATGQELDIKFDHLPNRTYRALVEEISDRHSEFAPNMLSNKAGGDLPTVTDRRGRERLTSHAYQALVLLEGDTELLRSNVRGRARFSVGHRSAAGWLWRAFRRTFHFRL